jgi:hypothetical protein
VLFDGFFTKTKSYFRNNSKIKYKILMLFYKMLHPDLPRQILIETKLKIFSLYFRKFFTESGESQLEEKCPLKKNANVLSYCILEGVPYI